MCFSVLKNKVLSKLCKSKSKPKKNSDNVDSEKNKAKSESLFSRKNNKVGVAPSTDTLSPKDPPLSKSSSLNQSQLGIKKINSYDACSSKLSDEEKNTVDVCRGFLINVGPSLTGKEPPDDAENEKEILNNSQFDHAAECCKDSSQLNFTEDESLLETLLGITTICAEHDNKLAVKILNTIVDNIFDVTEDALVENFIRNELMKTLPGDEFLSLLNEEGEISSEKLIANEQALETFSGLFTAFAKNDKKFTEEDRNSLLSEIQKGIQACLPKGGINAPKPTSKPSFHSLNERSAPSLTGVEV